MKRIWKYPLPFPLPTGVVEIEMPEGARVLCVQLQDGAPCLWALVDDCLLHRCWRRFEICETGGRCELEAGRSEYVGTVQLDAGDVIHVFDVGREID